MHKKLNLLIKTYICQLLICENNEYFLKQKEENNKCFLEFGPINIYEPGPL